MSYVCKYVEARCTHSIATLKSLTCAAWRMWSKPQQVKWGSLDTHDMVNPLGSHHSARMSVFIFIRCSKSAANMVKTQKGPLEKKHTTKPNSQYKTKHTDTQKTSKQTKKISHTTTPLPEKTPSPPSKHCQVSTTVVLPK